jgi:hypothetical protein
MFDKDTLAVCGTEIGLIREHYGNHCAARSGVPLINHIAEGVAILNHIGATVEAVKAYMLHPLVQSDFDLKRFFNQEFYTSGGPMIQPRVLLLMMEYRNQANNWLSDKVYRLMPHEDGFVEGMVLARFDTKPTSGPLTPVKHMLIADKVQNYKDFRTHHAGTHQRAVELDLYFRTWLDALGVSMEQFYELCAVIDNAKRSWA